MAPASGGEDRSPLPHIILAPDVALPGRDGLLDAEAVGRFLAVELRAGRLVPVGQCEVVHTNYRFGKHLRLLYRLRIGRRWRWVSACAFPDGAAEEAFRGATHAAARRAGLRAVVRGTHLGAVFCTFPNDPRLVRLAALLREAHALARRMGGPGSQVRIVRYKPETTLVLQLVEPSGRCLSYAKIYRPARGETAGRLHASLARQLRPDDPHLRLPAPLACVAGGQMLLLEAIEGRQIGELEGREAEVGLARLGAALATFHSLEPPVEAQRFTRYDEACLTEAASVLAQARPSLGPEAEALARELVRRFEPPPDRPVCLHGDMHTGNGILAGTGAALIDLDKVSLGPAAIDLGRLLCLLRYKRLVGRLTAADERARVASLLAGYAGRRPLPSSHALRWYAAAALLTEPAMQAVRRLQPEAIARLDLLLAEARRFLEGHSDA